MATPTQSTAVFSEQPTALAEVLCDIAAVRNQAVSAPVEKRLPGKARAVYADLFAQVITNLMSNAMNYPPHGGLILITAGMRTLDRQEWIAVMVQDTGPGISATDRVHIFGRFYQGAAARRIGAPGTGLGLAICKQIVDKLRTM